EGEGWARGTRGWAGGVARWCGARCGSVRFYDLLVAHVSPAPPVKLRLLDEAGRPTAAARAIEDFIGASLGKQEFFGADMYMFHVAGFRPERRVLIEPVRPADGARLDVWKADPADHRRIPAPGCGGVLFSTQAFALKIAETAHCARQSGPGG